MTTAVVGGGGGGGGKGRDNFGGRGEVGLGTGNHGLCAQACFEKQKF